MGLATKKNATQVFRCFLGPQPKPSTNVSSSQLVKIIKTSPDPTLLVVYGENPPQSWLLKYRMASSNKTFRRSVLESQRPLT